MNRLGRVPGELLINDRAGKRLKGIAVREKLQPERANPLDPFAETTVGLDQAAKRLLRIIRKGQGHIWIQWWLANVDNEKQVSFRAIQKGSTLT